MGSCLVEALQSIRVDASVGAVCAGKTLFYVHVPLINCPLLTNSSCNLVRKALSPPQLSATIRCDLAALRTERGGE